MRNLKVLMIGMDNNMLDSNSESWRRMKLYSTVFDELAIIVLNTGGKVHKAGHIAVYPTSLSKPLSFLKALIIGIRLLRHHSFDVISAQDPFVAGVIGYILKKVAKAHTAFQIQIHTGLFTPYFSAESLKTRFYVALAKLLLPRADCIKVVAHSIKDYLVDKLKIKPQSVSVLPVFVFFERFLDGEIKINLKERYPQFDFTLLMASRIVRQKNISMAIEALHQLTKKYPNMGLVIVGSGPDEENLKEKVATLNLKSNIVFEPWSDDLVSYYKTADLFVLTSDYEGWARTVLEAMASGLPVVMTDVGVAGEIVRHGENGIVVPVKDEIALANAIEELYVDESKREKLSQAGYETIVNLNFRDKDKYLELYRESFRPCLLKR